MHSDHTAAALEEVFDELRGLRERPISEEELASAREGARISPYRMSAFSDW